MLDMKYILSMGCNVGDGMQNFIIACNHMSSRKITPVEFSSVYSTSPVDYLKQSDFLNMATLIETDLSPQELLHEIKEIEHEMGRETTIPKGPRNIDIDIILWEKGSFESESLIIPHREHLNRMFVIVPTEELLQKSGTFPAESEKLRKLLLKKPEHLKNQKIEKTCIYR